MIDTPPKMQELIEWFQEEEWKSELHPVELAAILHHKYILIHPFDDGNSRVSRLLVNYVLMKNDLPPIIIKSAENVKYLQALRKADVGDMDSFVEYVAGELDWSLGLCLKAAKGEKLEEDDDWSKELKILSLKGVRRPVKRDSLLTLDRLKDSIGPLLLKIMESSSSNIEPMFEKVECTIIYGNRNIKINILKDQILCDVPHILSSLRTENNLTLNIYYQNFKKDGLNSFEMNKGVFVKFEDYKYFILDESQHIVIEKNINSKLTKNEISKFLFFYGKSALKEIKFRIDNSTIQQFNNSTIR